MAKQIATEANRQSFLIKLASNPNYFGKVMNSKQPVIQAPGKNTTYEDLHCVSYNPQSMELRAVVEIKQSNGFSGDSCTDGSFEYVRFFVDYLNNGTWVDEGVTAFNTHDIAHTGSLCYGVTLKIKPDFSSTCKDKPILPRVRAILSWNQIPTAGDANFTPFWGNVKEVNIQIRPKSKFFDIPFKDWTTILDKNNLSIASELKIKSIIEGAQVNSGINKNIAQLDNNKNLVFDAKHLLDLKKVYGNKVDDTRLGSTAIMMAQTKAYASNVSAISKSLISAKLDLAAVSDFVINSKYNTSFEELTCVGLNREINELHGAIHVKRPNGYMGDLCSIGSREYVAFYMDFGAGWKYMGTSSVQVHDIAEMPKDGLMYNIYLPVNLTPWQKAYCQAGIAKVRGILSWNILPPPNDPNYVAPWGDTEECQVEIKPLPKGVVDPVTPVISTLGGIEVDKINASGIANGQSTIVPAIKGIDSPFDGLILFGGIIGSALPGSKYRILVQEPGSLIFQPNTSSFTVNVTNINSGVVSFTNINQAADIAGYFTYLNDYVGPDLVQVSGNLLGHFTPSKSGLHFVKIETLGGDVSAVVPFMVDKSAPVVKIDITSGGGNCGTNFSTGDILSGTFNYHNEDSGVNIGDSNFLSVSLSLAPSGALGTPLFGTSGLPADPDAPSISYPTSAAITNQWFLNTATMTPCGYTVHIHATNRTIVSSSFVGKYDTKSQGFCIAK
jgi:hypothetical protein